MSEKYRVVSPEGLPLGAAVGISPPLQSLEGKTIGEVYNNHFKGELMFRTYRRLFASNHRGIKVIPFTDFPIVNSSTVPLATVPPVSASHNATSH